MTAAPSSTRPVPARRVLGDDSNQPQFIATVPRRGYRLIAPVTELPAARPATAVAPLSTEAPAAVEAGEATPAAAAPGSWSSGSPTPRKPAAGSST
jgi:hypothetical protein